MNVPALVSHATQKRLCIQGFGSYEPRQLAAYRFGIRFPYLLCAAIAVIGLAFTSIPVLAALMVIAFFGIILPYHPFDYLYNYGIRKFMARPKLPPRTPQIHFACGVAVFWLAVTIFLFSRGLILAGVIWGGILVGIASLVGLTDICIPSMVYNLLTNRRVLPRGY